MNQSETIAKLAEALSKAQGKMQGALRDSENPFFRSKYSDLSAIWKCAREPLSDNGLSVVQCTKIEDGKMILVSQLMHLSGEWIKSYYPVDAIKKDPQGWGSAMTYARRYSLQSLLGICAEDDDDGNAASYPPKQSRNDSPYSSPSPKSPDSLPAKENLKTNNFIEIINLIKKLTDNLEDKEKLDHIKSELKFSQSTEIQSWSENQQVDAIAWLRNNFNDSQLGWLESNKESKK